MTWRDAASVRIKLKVPTTQRHNRDRAARARWLAILKVRFLYGLPTYMSTYVVRPSISVGDYAVDTLLTVPGHITTLFLKMRLRVRKCTCRRYREY